VTNLPKPRKPRALPKVIAIGIAVVVVAVVALIVARPSTTSTGPDQVALHYKGGAFTSKRFADCIAPSNRAFDGPGDSHFTYPSSQTNYVFDQGQESDGGQITFVTRDGIEMAVEGVANFLLNTECEPVTLGSRRFEGGILQRFHELIGNRYQAYMTADGQRSQGWRQMLNVYIARPLDTAIDRAGQNYTYTELYTDPGKKAAWEQDVLDQLPELVNRQTDGDAEFFLSFAITLQKPEPPQAIKDALVQQQEAVARAKAAEAEAAAREAAARAQIAVEKAEAAKINERIKVLGQEGYLKQYAIDHGLNPYQPSTNGLITGPSGG
jgi:hypothetical protein